MLLINKVLKKLNPETNEMWRKLCPWHWHSSFRLLTQWLEPGSQITPDSSHSVAFMLKKGSLYSLEVEAEACIHRMAITFC